MTQKEYSDQFQRIPAHISGANGTRPVPYGAVPTAPHETPAGTVMPQAVMLPNLPSRFNLKGLWNGLFYDQGSRGTCVGQGFARMLEGDLLDLFGVTKTARRARVQSPMAIYNQSLDYWWTMGDSLRLDPRYDGTTAWAAGMGLKEKGGVPEDDYPYNTAQVGEEVPASLRRTTEYKVLDYTIGYGLDTLKQFLTAWGVSGIILAIDNGWFKGPAEVIHPDPASPIYSFHFQPVFGWDDDGQYVITLDSYGPFSGWRRIGYDMFEGTNARVYDVSAVIPDAGVGAYHKLAGDANADAKVNMSDVLLAAHLCVGMEDGLHPFAKDVLKLPGHDKVDVTDLRDLMRKAVGL